MVVGKAGREGRKVLIKDRLFCTTALNTISLAPLPYFLQQGLFTEPGAYCFGLAVPRAPLRPPSESQKHTAMPDFISSALASQPPPQS